MKTNIKNKKVLKLLEDVGLEQKPVQTKKLEDLDLDNFSTEDEKTLRQEENLLQLEIESLVERSKSLKVIDDSNIIEDEVSEEKRQYDENLASIRNKLERPFSLGRDVDTTSMREAAANNVLPKSLIPKQISYPEPFEEEPALNRELAEFKRKINEHLTKMGFAGGGGGAGFVGDLDDVNIDSRTHKSILMWNGVTNKYEVADPDLDAGIANEDDSGDEIILNGTTTSGADESGSIQQENETRMSLQDTTVSSLSLSDPTLTLTDSAGDTATVDLSTLVPDVATTETALATGRTIASTGDVSWTSSSFDGSGNVTGTAAIGSGVVVNADISASAAVAFSKMENLTTSRALVSDGNGDVSVSNVTSSELDIIDGGTSATGTTLAGTDRVVTNDNGTMVQVALTDFDTYFDGSLSFPALSAANTFSAAQSGSITVLSDGANISVDLSANNHFSVTLEGNRTLDNPSNIVAGTSGSFFITQDGTGSRTLSYGGYYDFASGEAPTLTTTAAAVDRIDYIARTTTSLHCVFTGNLS